MPITESHVRDAALRELANSPSGFMSTEELIRVLEDRLNPTGIDAQLLSGRADTHFSQKVRNLVSHRGLSTSLETRGLALYDEAREGWQITDKGRAYVGAKILQP